jgi:hypothetical protein
MTFKAIMREYLSKYTITREHRSPQFQHQLLVENGRPPLSSSSSKGTFLYGPCSPLACCRSLSFSFLTTKAFSFFALRLVARLLMKTSCVPLSTRETLRRLVARGRHMFGNLVYYPFREELGLRSVSGRKTCWILLPVEN